jgi:hypothetical protein
MLVADADLITLSQDLLLRLPIAVTLKHHWVKGHYQGKRQLSHELNHIADDLAGKFNTVDRPCSTSSPILPHLYEAVLLHENQMITSRMEQMLTTIMHNQQLRNYIQKQASWSEGIFDRIDWTAHQQVYQSYKRPQRISISKLVHGLLHTNKEANKFYGSNSLCPCCTLTTETFNHIFCCQEEGATANRHEALEKLRLDLERSKTPEKLITTLLHRIESWANSPNKEAPTPLYRGSIRPEDIALVQAFQDQNTIGWDHLHRGRISKRWRVPFLCGKGPSLRVDSWAKEVVRALWEYSKTLWTYRNGVVHGTTGEEEILRDREKLGQQVDDAFNQFQSVSFIVYSPQFSFLFTKKSKDDRKQMDRDAITSWLRTVAEAMKHQEKFRESLTKLSARFFKPKPKSIPSKGKPTLMVVDRCPLRSETLLDRELSEDRLTGEDDITEIEDDSTALSSDLDPG